MNTQAMTRLPFPYSGPDELAAPLLRALERVVDPEVAMNVVDVGLVYGVRAVEDRVEVDVTMTSAACPVADVILADIENELDRELPQPWKIMVRLVWEPPWSPARMSAGARSFMGW